MQTGFSSHFSSEGSANRAGSAKLLSAIPRLDAHFDARLGTSLGTSLDTREPVRQRSGSPAGWLLLAGIRFYQAVFSPLMPIGCKFYPSCSHYAAEAIARHGARRGAALALARLWRCRPFTQGGVDLVPERLDEMPERERSEFSNANAEVRPWL